MGRTQRSVITQWVVVCFIVTCYKVYDKITGHTKFPLTTVPVHSSVPKAFALITILMHLVFLSCTVGSGEVAKQKKLPDKIYNTPAHFRNLPSCLC